MLQNWYRRCLTVICIQQQRLLGSTSFSPQGSTVWRCETTRPMILWEVWVLMIHTHVCNTCYYLVFSWNRLGRATACFDLTPFTCLSDWKQLALPLWNSIIRRRGQHSSHLTAAETYYTDIVLHRQNQRNKSCRCHWEMMTRIAYFTMFDLKLQGRSCWQQIAHVIWCHRLLGTEWVSVYLSQIITTSTFLFPKHQTNHTTMHTLLAAKTNAVL